MRGVYRYGTSLTRPVRYRSETGFTEGSNAAGW